MTSMVDPKEGSFRLSMLINDTRYRSYTFQFLALLCLIAAFAYLGTNLVRNLAAAGLKNCAMDFWAFFFWVPDVSSRMFVVSLVLVSSAIHC